MDKKILISLAVVLAIVLAGVLVYKLSYKQSSMNSEQTIVKPPLTELGITDTVVGEGPVAEQGDEITVHYNGTLANGAIFDSSYLRNQPFVFKLGIGMVIEGWEKGFEGMHVGGKRTIAIPASMAYGSVTQGAIPANSDLYFDVELLGIKGK